MGTDDSLSSLFGAIERCNNHVISFVSYIAAAKPDQEYYIEGLEDLNAEGVELERTLQRSIEPVLSDLIVSHPKLGALIAANLAYIKLIILGISSSSVLAKNAALDEIIRRKAKL